MHDKTFRQNSQTSLDNYLLFEQPSTRLLAESGIENLFLVWHFVFTLWGTSEWRHTRVELL